MNAINNKNLSERALDLISNPRFAQFEGSGFDVRLEESGQLKSVIYSTEVRSLSLLACEVLARIFQGKSYRLVSLFSFREFENYLRDTNEKKAFSEGDFEIQATFESQKLNFLKAIYRYKLENTLKSLGELPEKPEHLAGQNKFWGEVLEGLGLELIYYRGGELTFSAEKEGLTSALAVELFSDLLQELGKHRPIKLVAV